MTPTFDPSLWNDDDFDYLRENSDRFVISRNIPGALEITVQGYDMCDALEDFLGDVLELDELYTITEQNDEVQIFVFAGLDPDLQATIVAEIEKLTSADQK